MIKCKVFNFTKFILFKLVCFSPEALGVVTGCLFLITMFLFIPVPFATFLFNGDFPHEEVCLHTFVNII